MRNESAVVLVLYSHDSGPMIIPFSGRYVRVVVIIWVVRSVGRYKNENCSNGVTRNHDDRIFHVEAIVSLNNDPHDIRRISGRFSEKSSHAIHGLIH